VEQANARVFQDRVACTDRVRCSGSLEPTETYMNRLIVGMIVVFGFWACRSATAQVWEARDRVHPHALSLGVGSSVGVLGIRYTHAIGNTPLAAGLGVGAGAAIPQIEMVLGPEGTQHYLGIGLMVGWAGTLRNTGTLTIELGRRQWFSDERTYFDVGLAFLPSLWGEPDFGLLGIAFPRGQFGFTF
jgi:hypothetical protein